MADGMKSYGRVVLMLAALPFFAFYGAWVVLRALLRLIRSIGWTVRLTRTTIRCSCGARNSVYGRWQCQSPGCGVTYHGAVDICTRCGSGASYFACRSCQ